MIYYYFWIIYLNPKKFNLCHYLLHVVEDHYYFFAFQMIDLTGLSDENLDVWF